MQIRTLYLSNWKCFSDDLSLEFNNVEIFSFPNGYGKSAVLQALHYGLWGKTDYNLASYQNHDDKTKVTVTFDSDGKNYKVERCYGKSTHTAVLYVDDKEFRKGITEVFDYMNTIMDYHVAKLLWFNGEISDTPILDFNFFKQEILTHQLEEPTKLSQYYQKEITALNREAKTINYKECRPIEEIEKELDECTRKLKDNTNKVNNNQYIRALSIKEAATQLEKVNGYFLVHNTEPLPQQEILRWNNLNKEQLEKQLEVEQNKCVDTTLKNINNQALQTIITHYDNNDHKCLICDNKLSDDKATHMKQLLTNGVKDVTIEKDLMDKLKFKLSITPELIQQSQQYYNLTSKVNQMPNYETIINNYNAENEKIWDKFNALSSEKDAALYNKNALDRLEELNKKIIDYKEKKKFLQDYLTKATAALTANLFNESTTILNEINPDYTGIMLSAEDNTIKVIVKGKTLSLNQISRGEKTIVALSLIYTIRDLFCPGAPLFFDESFSALSKNNNTQVIELVKHSFEQIFVVSHSVDWTENGSTNNVTIRTTWD